jgi:prophage DNA circulation protein
LRAFYRLVVQAPKTPFEPRSRRGSALTSKATIEASFTAEAVSSPDDTMKCREPSTRAASDCKKSLHNAALCISGYMRSAAASVRAVNDPVRSVTDALKSVTDAVRSVTNAVRSVTDSVRSVTDAVRSVTERRRSRANWRKR